MGMFGFFKNKKVEPSEVIKRKLGFEEIEKWVSDKEERLGKEEKLAIDEILGKLDEFYISVGEKLEVLEGIDIEGKKEHGRAKILVRQGLNNYIDLVKGLIGDLRKIGKDDLGKFGEEVGRVFVLFEKSSAKFYERATYLVGDEMVAVRNEIRKFYNGLVGMFEDSMIGDLRKVVEVKLILKEVGEVEDSIAEVEKEISVRDKKIDEAKGQVVKLEREIDEIRKSAEYVSGLKVVEEVKAFEARLDKEIVRLKEMIDFKKLIGIVHSNARELSVVKEYREHFVSEFSRDGDKIIGLLARCNMKSSLIVAQVDLIKRRELELKELKDGIGKDYTIDRLNEIGKIKDEREGIELENIKGNRRLEELNLKLKGLRNEAVGLVGG